MKKVAVLFSGAKDSTFAIYKAMNMGMEVKYLLTLIPKRDDSYMFHHPNIKWANLQAEALGIELKTMETEGEKERELNIKKWLVRIFVPILFSALGYLFTILLPSSMHPYLHVLVDMGLDDYKLPAPTS